MGCRACHAQVSRAAQGWLPSGAVAAAGVAAAAGAAAAAVQVDHLLDAAGATFCRCCCLQQRLHSQGYGQAVQDEIQAYGQVQPCMSVESIWQCPEPHLPAQASAGRRHRRRNPCHCRPAKCARQQVLCCCGHQQLTHNKHGKAHKAPAESRSSLSTAGADIVVLTLLCRPHPHQGADHILSMSVHT